MKKNSAIFSTFLLFLIQFHIPLHLSARGLAPLAKISRLRGNVLINKEKAKLGSYLKTNDYLEVKGKGHFVEISYFSGTRMLLKQGKAKITELKPKNTSLSLIKGVIFVHAQKGENLKIQTKNTSMGVRGTKFYVDEKANETYLCVCDGLVELSNKQGKITLKQNEDIRANASTKKFKVTSPGLDMWKMAKQGFTEMGLEISRTDN